MLSFEISFQTNFSEPSVDMHVCVVAKEVPVNILTRDGFAVELAKKYLGAEIPVEASQIEKLHIVKNYAALIHSDSSATLITKPEQVEKLKAAVKLAEKLYPTYRRFVEKTVAKKIGEAIKDVINELDRLFITKHEISARLPEQGDCVNEKMKVTLQINIHAKGDVFLKRLLSEKAYELVWNVHEALTEKGVEDSTPLIDKTYKCTATGYELSDITLKFGNLKLKYQGEDAKILLKLLEGRYTRLELLPVLSKDVYGLLMQLEDKLLRALREVQSYVPSVEQFLRAI